MVESIYRCVVKDVANGDIEERFICTSKLDYKELAIKSYDDDGELVLLNSKMVGVLEV